MQRFKEWIYMAIDRFIVSIWVPVLIIAANALCAVANILNGASDWSLLGSAIGCTFAIKCLYNWYRFKKENEAIIREVAEKIRQRRETREQARKNHSDESNPDKP